MSRSSFLHSCAVMALMCGFAHAAAAAPVNMPAQDWTVGKISAKSESGLSYCSMKNLYQNGQMLVFARDGAGSNSIALDFKKDWLEVGRQYAVTIRTGILTRALTAIAATKQVMIVQLGKDKDFYDTLQHKSEISFDTGNNKYVFTLDTAVPDALKAMDECSASLQSGADFKEAQIPHGAEKAAEEAVADAPVQAPSLPNMAITQSLQDDVERLKVENRKLQLENQKMEGDLLAHENKAAPKETADNTARKELGQLKAENEKLQAELAAQKNSLPQAAPVNAAAQADLQAELDRLKAENQNLQATQGQANVAAQADLQSELSRVKAENIRIQQELAHKDNIMQSQSNAARQADMQFEIDRLKAENQKLSQNEQASLVEAKPEVKAEAPQQAVEQAPREVTVPVSAETITWLQDKPAETPAAAIEEKAAIPEQKAMVEEQPAAPVQAASQEAALPPPAEELYTPPTYIAKAEPAVMPVPAPEKQPIAETKGIVEQSVVPPQATATGHKAYRWVSDDIYGAAQELSWPQGKTFTDLAGDYIKKASSVCRGDFAQKMGNVRKAGGVDVLESEMICMDGQNDAVAAILFVSDHGKFSIVTQEGTVDQLPAALAKRDAILSIVSQN